MREQTFGTLRKFSELAYTSINFLCNQQDFYVLQLLYKLRANKPRSYPVLRALKPSVCNWLSSILWRCRACLLILSSCPIIFSLFNDNNDLFSMHTHLHFKCIHTSILRPQFLQYVTQGVCIPWILVYSIYLHECLCSVYKAFTMWTKEVNVPGNGGIVSGRSDTVTCSGMPSGG